MAGKTKAELQEEVKRLRKLCNQHIDDKEAIRNMLDPDGRFVAESVVWVTGWMVGRNLIQQIEKTEQGWGVGPTGAGRRTDVDQHRGAAED